MSQDDTGNGPRSFDVSIDMQPPAEGRGTASMCSDDDGRLKRTGTVWTASAHIITAVIGSGIPSLAWATAQLGWIAGPVVLFLFSFVNYYTSVLLAKCYRSGDPVTGKRNYTYMEAVHANLGGIKAKLCGLVQNVDLYGVAIAHTIAASISMAAIQRSHCFHKNGHHSPCHKNSNHYMIEFGIIQIVVSQIPDFDQLWWLSIVTAIMSFSYSTIGLGLGVAKVSETKKVQGSLTGIRVGHAISSANKVWQSFQALGEIAFAYSFSMILIEIQDTVKSPPSETKTMKKAILISVAVTTLFHMLCGYFGYAAFGDMAPGNLLTGFGFYGPHWLVDIANVAIAIHHVGAYQVYCQPLFSFIEKFAHRKFPNSKFITQEIEIPVHGLGHPYKLKLFRLVWRSVFVVITTVISMLLPFFNDVVGLLGALGFWPLTVYFPIEMYIAHMNIPKWSSKWVSHQVLSGACLIISLVAAAGSVVGIVTDLKTYKPFKSVD